MHQQRNPDRPGGQPDRDRHIPTGGQHHVGPKRAHHPAAFDEPSDQPSDIAQVCCRDHPQRVRGASQLAGGHCLEGQPFLLGDAGLQPTGRAHVEHLQSHPHAVQKFPGGPDRGDRGVGVPPGAAAGGDQAQRAVPSAQTAQGLLQRHDEFRLPRCGEAGCHAATRAGSELSRPRSPSGTLAQHRA